MSMSKLLPRDYKLQRLNSENFYRLFRRLQAMGEKREAIKLAGP